MIAGGNQETADIPGLPVKALYTVEMINLETLNELDDGSRDEHAARLSDAGDRG